MADDASELDRLDPQLATLTLRAGQEVEVVRMRTRQIFRLLKILTFGAGPALLSSQLDFSAQGEDFAQRLLSLIVMSIPEAEEQAIQFIQSMVRPVSLGRLYDKPQSKFTKAERESWDAAFEELGKELFNPHPADTIAIIRTVITQEAGEIQDLGKQLASMVELVTKTGEGKPEPAPTAAEVVSRDRSRRRSTSSPASTGGRTSES